MCLSHGHLSPVFAAIMSLFQQRAAYAKVLIGLLQPLCQRAKEKPPAIAYRCYTLRFFKKARGFRTTGERPFVAAVANYRHNWQTHLPEMTR